MACYENCEILSLEYLAVTTLWCVFCAVYGNDIVVQRDFF